MYEVSHFDHNFDKDENEVKVQVSNTEIIVTDPEFPNCLLFKTTYEQEEFKTIDLPQRGGKRILLPITSFN